MKNRQLLGIVWSLAIILLTGFLISGMNFGTGNKAVGNCTGLLIAGAVWQAAMMFADCKDYTGE